MTADARTTKFGNVAVHYFGHASFMLEAELQGKPVRIYVDPFILPDSPAPADLVLFTHGHHDHCADPKKILKAGTRTAGCHCKFASESFSPGGKLDFGFATVEAVHAYNPAKPFHPKDEGCGVIVEFAGTRVYHAGDTDSIPEMKNYRCDVALLPIGGKFTMDIRGAAEAAREIGPKLAIPMHYNTFDEITADPEAFAKLLEGSGIEVRIL